jgi:cell division septum initiation protein DivIVA
MSNREPQNDPSSDATSLVPPTFEKVRRGYDPKAVSEYLTWLVSRLQTYENQVTDLEAELAEARRSGDSSSPAAAADDPYAAFSDHVADVVRAFDEEVERKRSEAEEEVKGIVDEARSRAEAEEQAADDRRHEAQTELQGMVDEARAEADRIRVDAQAKAEEIRARADQALEDARTRATEMLSELESQRGSLLIEMRSIRDRMLEAARTLDPVLEDQPAADDVTVVEGHVAVSSEESGDSVEVVTPGR